MLSNTNFIDNAEIWINLRERIRMVFSPLIKLTHLGTRIELLYSNFISIPFYLSDVNDLFSLRKKKSQLHTRLVTILGFQWDRSSHTTRFMLNVNNQYKCQQSTCYRQFHLDNMVHTILSSHRNGYFYR